MCEKGTFFANPVTFNDSYIAEETTDQHLFMNDEDVLAPTEVITLPSNDTCTWF